MAGIAIGLTALYVVLLVWDPGQIVVIPWFVPMVFSFFALTALSVAFLALGRCQVLRDSASYWIGTAFADFGILLAFYVLTWPGLLPDERAIIGQLTNTPAWMLQVAVSFLGVLLLVAVLARWPGERELAGRGWLPSVAAWLGFVTALGVLSVAFEGRLPALIGEGGTFTAILLGWNVVLVVVFALGAALSIRRYRTTEEVLLGYVALSQEVFALAILTSLFGDARRYDLWWFTARIVLVGGALVVLFGLLFEYVGLYRRERDRSRELEVLREEAEERVEEARLRAAELDTANQDLEAFAYSVAHDLRAPARQVASLSELLMHEYADRPLDESGKEYLRLLRDSSQREGQLIDDLLLLSSVTRAEMRRGPVDLSAIARSVETALRARNPDRQVELTVEPGLVAEGDPRLLRIALDNLLDNAWKFTANRPVAKIEFGATHQDGRLVYYVRDNGVGFDMTYVGKLFGAFERLHRADEFPGSGIGLATVQRIVQRHGGRAWAEGAVGVGATFYFTLG